MTTAVEAPKAKNSSSAASARSVTDIDLVRSYLRDIGRVPLLSHEQEITLGRQVQDLVVLERLVDPLLQEDLVLRGCLVNLQIIFIEKLG